MGRKASAMLLAALTCALAGFFCARMACPVWEARATLAVDSPAALLALPGMLAAEGSAAYAIPGTDVMELALRGPSPEDAQTRLTAALDRLPALLSFLDLSANTETLASAVRCLSRPDPAKYALSGGLLGALAAALLLLPAPRPREPLNLGKILKTMARTAKRRTIPILLTVVLLAFGNVLLPRRAPQVQAQMLVRTGIYNPDTADGLAGAVLGLLDSQLADSAPDAVRVGRTNLFRLTFRAESEGEALSAAENFSAHWPRLAEHISGAPGLTVLEGPTLAVPSPESPGRAALTGAGLALALWLLLLAGEALRREDALCSGG